MKPTTSTILTNLFAFVCILVGLWLILRYSEAFTSHSLIETILFTAALLFLLSKYVSAKIISRYQDGGYAPSRVVRLSHDIIVNVCVFMVQPVCLSLLYACVPLLFIKFFAVDKLDVLADLTYRVYRFNKEYISQPKGIILGILSILTLFNFLSLQYFKKTKSVIRKITMPLGTIAMLTLFINIDTGITTKSVSWKINTSTREFKAEKLTFNATQEQKIRKIVDAYVEAVATQLLSESHFIDPAAMIDSMDIPFIEATINGLHITEQKNPVLNHELLKLDLYEGKAYGGRVYLNEEVETIKTTIRNAPPSFNEVPFNADLHEMVKPENSEKYKSFMDLLNDERTSITAEPKVGKNESILKAMLKEELVDKSLNRLTGSIDFYSFIKDPMFDLIKTKVNDGFFHLLKKSLAGVLAKEDMNEVMLYLKSELKHNVEKVTNYIKDKKMLLAGFYSSYDRALDAYDNLRRGVGTDDIFEVIRKRVREFPNDPFIDELMQIDLLYKNRDLAEVSASERRFWKNYLSFVEGGVCSEDVMEIIINAGVYEPFTYEGNGRAFKACKLFMEQLPGSADNLAMHNYFKSDYVVRLEANGIMKEVQLAKRSLLAEVTLARTVTPALAETESFWARAFRVLSKVHR